MYIKLKNGNIYATAMKEGDFLYIYTLYAEKAGAGFEKTQYGYKKRISVRDDDVEEYFSLNWKIRLDVGIKGVPDEWIIRGDSDLAHGKVLLRFTRGNIPGWMQEDRGVCSKEYDFGLSTAWWTERFVPIRNGVDRPNAGWEKTVMTKAEFLKSFEFYNCRTL